MRGLLRAGLGGGSSAAAEGRHTMVDSGMASRSGLTAVAMDTFKDAFGCCIDLKDSTRVGGDA
jgi:hypothetical protein